MRRPSAVTFHPPVSSSEWVAVRTLPTDRYLAGGTDMPTEQQIKDAWIEHRPYLVDMAFRMLGDIGRAEDVVQEAFQRLSRSDFDAIEDARGWLIVVTSRLCLDVTRSARNRRERPVERPELAEHLDLARLGSVDPADRVTLDD